MPSTTTAASDGWQLETDSAESYERYLVPALMAAGADRLVDLAVLRPGERVLDVGCGTGIVARRAAEHVGLEGRVTGLDLNPGMLAVAERAGAGLRPAITWRTGNAASLPFPDQSFDLVLSQQMLQFVPDPPVVLAEMRRVLAPGGRLVLGVCRALDHAAGYGTLVEGLRRHAGPKAADMMRSPFPAWTTAFLRQILTDAGFTRTEVRIDVLVVRYPSASELLRREAASSPLAGLVSALPPADREALIGDLEVALEERRDDQGLVLPLEVYNARAER